MSKEGSLMHKLDNSEQRLLAELRSLRQETCRVRIQRCMTSR